MFDILIKNALVADGTGKPIYWADVGIKEERIAKIGDLSNEKGEEEIEANERLLCPGFIDVNNHSDTYWRIFSNPDLESLVSQGITTVIGGSCGSSLAPLANMEAIYSIQKWGNINQININWQTLKEFLKTVEKKKLALNFGTLVGQGTLRRGVMKDATRIASLSEFNSLKSLLSQSLKEGALGLSSGLVYVHERKASIGELEELLKIVKKYQGVYVTHLRDERKNLLEALEETVALADKEKIKLHISHLKAMEKSNWKKMDDALALVDETIKRGVDITFDVYPYDFTGTVLYTLLPSWISEGGKKIMLQRLKDQEIRKKVVIDLKSSKFDWSKVEVSKSFLSRVLDKKKIADIARAQEKSPEEAVIDILIASEGTVVVFTESLSEKNLEKALVHSAAIVASNGSGYNLKHAESGERVHPRSFGAFPRVFSRYVRKKKILSWEEAVKKMTSLPAQKFGLKKRGEIKEGFFADLALIDRNKVEDLSDKESPYRYSQGVDLVVVNGHLTLKEGKILSPREGKVLMREEP